MHRPTSSDTPAAEPAEGLTELARLHGIDTEFRAEDGTRVRTPPHTLVAVLRALGVDATTPGAVAAALVAHRRRTAERLLPGDCVVARQGATAMLRVPEAAKVWIELEGGGRLDVPAGSDDEPSTRVLSAIPLGYHRVRVRLGERHDSAALIVCPARIAQPERRLWGYAAHLYALLSERSWGMGDLTDLADLAQWSARMHDAGFVVVNPLHAMMPVAFADHSPYWPSDRCFPDPVHVRVEDVPEYRGLDTLARRAVEEVAAAASELRRNVMSGHGLVERDRVWDLKRRALRTVYQAGLSPERAVAYRAFLEREGERLDLHATWWALADRYGPDWRTWPAGLSDPGGPEVARARERYADDVDFRRWLVWVTDEQMAGVQRAALDAGMPIGVIHDLSVGVHPSGAEAWSLQHCLASGITVGAPPDVFNAQGQDWCLPPWRPDALAAHGYEPYARVLRGVLRHAGALRLDHAMGLFRLWWVPEGRPVSDGTYVRYDHEAMLAVLTLEAHRAGTPVIGEDLGTVEPEVRTELSDRGILGTSMLWMERSVDGYGGSVPRRAGEWRAECLAALTNHDLPSTAARLTGRHVDVRVRHGMIAGSVERERAAAALEMAEWREALWREGVLPADVEEPAEIVAGLYRYLLRTPARLVCLWLPDGVGDLRSPNLPGVFDAYPNWQLPLADEDSVPLSLERVKASARLDTLAGVLRAGSGRSLP